MVTGSPYQVDSFVKTCLLNLYSIFVQLVLNMDTVSVTKFRENLRILIDEVVTNHIPLKVTHRSGSAFIVMSSDEWEREQETLHILQNSSLMKQISDSMATHNNTDHTPISDKLD